MAASAGTALAGEVVEIDKMQLLVLPQPASNIIVGDPTVADVSVFSDTRVYLMGRGYGETNLLILDQVGNVILDTDIIVTGAQTSKGVTLTKVGEGRETYHCASRCQPSPKLGDEARFISEFESDEPLIQNPVAQTQNTPAVAAFVGDEF